MKTATFRRPTSPLAVLVECWRFERMLRERSPRSIDGVEWATYNQWASEQRTARRIKTEKEQT